MTSVLDAEGTEIIKHLDQDAYNILWDRTGQKISSVSFAKLSARSG
jgi:23S rRNA pseudoU1915 N3-methylase RlmH